MKIVLLLLLLVSCGKESAVFKYGDKVEILSGFYKGSQGTVIAYDSRLFFLTDEYLVSFESRNDWMSAEELKKIEESR